MKTSLTALTLGLSATLALAQDLPAPVSDANYRPVSEAEARLGQLLFYDPILSGNRNVACATCHHPKFGTSDGVSLSFGEGGIGLGPERMADPQNIPEERIPRNAPALFNLGAREFTVMFHDGRLEETPVSPGGLRTPLGEDMLDGFASVLAAQTMFPVLSRDEMAGSYNENKVAALVRQGRITGPGGAWDMLSKRVSDLPGYADQFLSVYPHITTPQDISFADISNAIAAFMEFEWRADASLFDAVLRGQAQLEGASLRGLELFYGAAGCAACHSGPFLTDHGFHSMGAPQIGPGKSATFEDHHRDDGRFRVTGDPADRFAFRTPSLRNISLTAPYGHAGAHRDLAAFIAAHADPFASLDLYDPAQALLPPFRADDWQIMTSQSEREAIRDAVTVRPVSLTAADIADLVSFLDTLSDPASISGRLGIPDTVPSGLQVP